MNALGQMVLFSWFVLGTGVVGVFKSMFGGPWGVVLSLLLGWMLLPMGEVDLPGLPPVNKNTVTAGAALLGVVIFDASALGRFKPRLIDLPMAVWCVVPILSTFANGPMDSGPPAPPWAPGQNLEAYDAVALFFTHSVTWGVPWVLGRIYLQGVDAHRVLLLSMFFMGLFYMPLVWVEMKMSPQWHNWLYGVHAHPDFSQTMRYGFWRPNVFMQHGLMVAFFMTSTFLAGYAAWKMHLLKKIKGIPSWGPLSVLGATAVLCMSMGAWIQLVVGVFMIEAVKRFRMPMLLAVLALMPPAYLTARIGLGMSADSIQETVARVNEDRAESVGVRFTNEDWIMEHALERPLLGWAGWGRERIYDRNGKMIGITDGLWTIAISRYGLIGLVSLYAWLILPAVLALRKLPTTSALAPFAGTIAVALIVLQLAIDTIPNAMTGPVYVAAAGGLAGLASIRGRVRSPEDLLALARRRTSPGPAGEPGPGGPTYEPDEPDRHPSRSRARPSSRPSPFR
ncbi:MAG: hypothetical protein ACF8Q5_15105 [Phycisphaerales bacterium JB040]